MLMPESPPQGHCVSLPGAERGRVGVRTLLLALPFHVILNHAKSLGEANDLLGVLARPPQHTELADGTATFQCLQTTSHVTESIFTS